MLEAWVLLLIPLTAEEVAEYRWLPPHDYCEANRQVGLEFVSWVEGLRCRAPAWQDPRLLAALDDARLLQQFWCHLSWATYKPCDLWYRRWHREEARRMIGEEDWMRQQFPPAIPIWRLSPP